MDLKSKSVSSYRSQSIHGKHIQLRINSYGCSAGIREYVVENCPFPVQHWLTMTAVLTAIFLKIGLQDQDNSVLVLVVFILFLILSTRLRRKVREESLVIITSLGIQHCTTFVTGSKVCKFIAWENVEGLIINEGISMQRILFYLAILTRSRCGKNGTETQKLVPLFQETLPRLDCLEIVYRSTFPLFPNRAT